MTSSADSHGTPTVPHATHEVFNQSSPLVDYNSWRGDQALREAVRRHEAGWAADALDEHGARTGSAEVIEWGFLANRFPPQFHPHDRQGRRIDEVEYHPAYHELMALGLRTGLHASPWVAPRAGAHVARAALYYLQAQMESGHGCPLTMTFAAVPALRLTPAVGEQWLAKVLAFDYDPRNLPFTQKQAVTIGMGMTEKQGGSDVRSNTTRARPLSAPGSGEAYALTGHKWFTSAPMCDAFLMLAQTEAGLGCFLVPRWRPDGVKNGILVQRLKQKMGNVANASSEIELREAMGWLIGEEGRGVPAIIQMVAMTRFDCMIGSSAAQRQAVAQAVHHAREREAFGRALIDQPLMRNVLADLQLEVEGALALTMRMAEALDRSQSADGDAGEALLLRLGLPVGKYWICKRTPHHTCEAMECLGGNGVTEAFISSRLYRDAPINAIWEGSGNIQALDVLRVLERQPEALAAWLEVLAGTRGEHRLLDTAVDRLKRAFADTEELALRARHLADQLALTMQGALLLEAGCTAVADAFIVSRLGSAGDRSYGTLPRGTDFATLLQRADPLAY